MNYLWGVGVRGPRQHRRQASLAWLLDKSMGAAHTGSSPFAVCGGRGTASEVRTASAAARAVATAAVAALATLVMLVEGGCSRPMLVLVLELVLRAEWGSGKGGAGSAAWWTPGPVPEAGGGAGGLGSEVSGEND